MTITGEQPNWRYLMERYLSGAITKTELESLLSMAAVYEKPEELDAVLKAHWEKVEKAGEQTDRDWDNKLAARLVEENRSYVTAHRVHFLKTAWFRYAAAVIVLVGAGLWWLMVGQRFPAGMTGEKGISRVEPVIAAGGNKAVLTLANGSRIVLDDAQNGNIAEQGNSKISKTANGQLAYTILNGKSTEVVYNTLSTPRGGEYKVTLPDGSQVWLNAASSITYPTTFVGGTRSVEITGEVYIEVKKNAKQPFYVTTRKTTIQVLGTSFNVNAYDDEEAIKTTLIEGSVRVIPVGSNERAGDFRIRDSLLRSEGGVILKPGQQASFHPMIKRFTLQSTDIELDMAWKNGMFEFKNAAITTVMRQAARWYDLEIVYGENITETLNGSIPRNVTAAEFFKVLEMTDELRFTIEGKKVTVRKK